MQPEAGVRPVSPQRSRWQLVKVACELLDDPVCSRRRGMRPVRGARRSLGASSCAAPARVPAARTRARRLWPWHDRPMRPPGADLLDVLTPLEVARLEEARLAKVLADVSLEHEPFAGGTCGFGGIGSWQNGAYGAGLAGAVEPEAIDRFCTF
jgi:hypothetical protein